MRIYKPRGVTKSQVFIATLLGVIGGVYIWRPLLLDHFQRQKLKETAVSNPSE